MSAFPWRVTASATCVVASCVLLGAAAGQQGLNQIFETYARGDYDVVAQFLTNSRDYQRHNLFERRRLERWLGAWSPDKAAFLAELVGHASSVAPAYLPNLVVTGQRYVLGRTSQPGASPREDDLERRWHLIAVAAMQRRFLGQLTLQYVDVLRTRRELPAAAAVWDPRIDLARGIAQEQRCRALHATARQDRLLAELEGVAATPPLERQAAIDCMRTVLAMFETAAAREEVRPEAHTRAGFATFQLGQNPEARSLLDGARLDADRPLMYWRSLFSGRVADALGEDAQAETAYRAALAAYPEAQSARVGLALALFRMNRSDEADAAMLAARQVRDESVDPWEIYFEGDGRFVRDWVLAMRKARQ